MTAWQTRRGLLLNGALVAAGLGAPASLAQQELALTPECTGKEAVTIRQTEGPFYKPRTPERSNLIEPGMTGQVIEIAGLVLTRGCKPVARALIDVWQADHAGDYDNDGFRLRGHLYSDAEGRYRFRTIVPARYPGRTRHIHVKVVPPQGGRVLTTQLYFPGESENRRDPLFRRELLMSTAKNKGEIAGRFDFVLDA